MPDRRFDTRTGQLDEMVERDPATALYLPLAERLRDEGRVEEAIRLCEARKNRPGHGVGDAIVLGRCYLADGRLNEARAEFEAALSLDRENVAALKALAGILAHEGRHARAVDLYRAVCRVDPGDLESQTALHQITSGEYADVCPADVVVGQGDLGWHPVRLPREEEHLSDLGLGLRTIESFDAPAADAEEAARSRRFQELSLDELESGTVRARDIASNLDAPATPGAAPAPGAALAPEMLAAVPIEVPPPPREAPAHSSEAPAPGEAQGAAHDPPDPPLAPRADEPVRGNRSAFEDWIRRMAGGA